MGSRAARDMGLARIGTFTRWMAVGAVVGGGVLTAAVAKVLPGRSSTSSSSGVATAPAPVSPSGEVNPGLGGSSAYQGSSGGGLSAPVQAPQPIQSPPIVSSGGS